MHPVRPVRAGRHIEMEQITQEGGKHGAFGHVEQAIGRESRAGMNPQRRADRVWRTKPISSSKRHYCFLKLGRMCRCGEWVTSKEYRSKQDKGRKIQGGIELYVNRDCGGSVMNDIDCSEAACVLVRRI